MWHKLTPLFGRGATYESWGKQLEVPDTLHRQICQWDQIVFLRNAKKLDLIWRMARLSNDPAAFDRLEALIKKNQGFALFQVIEGAKIALTSEDLATIHFTHPDILIDEQITLAEFDANTADLTAQIMGRLDSFMSDAKLDHASIETVFLTGGTSMIRNLRNEFDQRFGADRIRDGGEFTSVADGLALSAPLYYPELHS